MKKIFAFRNKNKKFTKRFTIIFFFNYILLSLFSKKYRTYLLSKHLLFSFPIKQVFFSLKKQTRCGVNLQNIMTISFFFLLFLLQTLSFLSKKNKYPVRVLSV